jgi:hypothetical protein
MTMTIASTLSKTLYVGNGSTASFAIPFMFLRDEDIELVLLTNQGERAQTISTDYSLSGAGGQTGGVCTMTTPPDQGEVLVIRRNPAMVQEVDYVENDAFPAATHEAALDKLTMICQALAERLDRTITFRVSSAVTGVRLPEPQPGRSLAWNDAGDDLTNKDTVALGALLLPLSVTQGGTGGQSAPEALANLGFGSLGMALAASQDAAGARAVMEAQPADAAILKADTADLIQAVYGDEAQVYGYVEGEQATENDLSNLTVSRNHILWTLTGASQFSLVDLPYNGTYVFHVYPDGNTLSLASAYKTDGAQPLPNSLAGEVRITVERFNTRTTILAVQNLEA